MATLAQLKTRVILQVNRDDMGSGGALEQALIDSYTRAIEYYADLLFWFNIASGTKVTVAGTATIALPTGVRFPTELSYQQEAFRKVKLEDIQDQTTQGQPYSWAMNESLIQLYPVPDAVYTLNVYGIADLGVPASTNEWTTEAYDLIVQATCKILYRDYLRDTEGATLASLAETEAFQKLRRESRVRDVTGLSSEIAYISRPKTFNINRGW